jgi:hypothetical protein
LGFVIPLDDSVRQLDTPHPPNPHRRRMRCNVLNVDQMVFLK